MRLRIRLKETRQILSASKGTIFLFELMYRLLTLPILMQMAAGLLRMSLKASGYSYVTTNNLALFLMKPTTIAAALILAVAILFGLMLEVGGVMTALQAASLSRRINFFAIITGGIAKTAREIRHRNWKVFVVVAIHYILTNIFLIYRLLSHVKPIKFILPGLLAANWGRFLIVVFLTACVVISIPTAFICFGCMVEQKSFRGSLYRSRELLQGNYLKTSITLVICNLLVLLAGILLYLFAIVLVAVFAVWFIDPRIELALILAVRDRIEYIMIFFTSIFLVIVNYSALTVMYVRYAERGRQGAQLEFGLDGSSGVRWLKRKNVLGLLAVISAVSMAFVFDSARNGNGVAENMFYEVQITAHRGSSASAPENTMPALYAAVDEFSDYAEVDVQETKDGVLVLFHDSSLRRISDTSGSVRSMTYEELQQIDVGGWFSEDFAGTRIPTLEEALEFSKGRIKLNIEIKDMGNSSRLPEKVVDSINQAEFGDQCVVTSTSLPYLKRVKEADPLLYTGYIVPAAYGAYYRENFIDFISIMSSSLDQRLVDLFHENGKEVHAWTVNRRSEMERMKLLGVDNVITDHPVLAREVLYGEKNTENLLARIREMLR